MFRALQKFNSWKNWEKEGRPVCACMELVSETHTELYFHKNPLKVELVAVGLFISGVLIILIFGWKTELQCNCENSGSVDQLNAKKVKNVEEAEGERKKEECGGWCNTTMTNLWMVREQNIPTRIIRAALVEGSAGAYRVLLLLAIPPNDAEYILNDGETNDDDDDNNGKEQTIPLLHYYYSYGGYETKRRLANKINSIVNGMWEAEDDGVVLLYTQDDRWYVYFILYYSPIDLWIYHS